MGLQTNFGGLGDCWLMAALACLAEYPAKLKGLFESKHITEEIFSFKSEADNFSLCHFSLGVDIITFFLLSHTVFRLFHRRKKVGSSNPGCQFF